MKSQNSKLSKILLAMLCGSVVMACGCSNKPPTGTVTGTVTFEGEPYSNAGIMFLSLETGNGSGSKINPDGSYALADPIPVGTYSVYLAPKEDEEGPTSIDQPVPVYMDKTIPAEYWSESTTKIKFDVKEGPNVFPVDIKR